MSNATSASGAPSEQNLSLGQSLRILFKASRAFWLVNLVNFGDGLTYFGILTLLTRFLGTDLGLSDGMAGITVSAFTGTVTLFMFGGGYVSDRLGVRHALSLSLLVMALGRFLLVLAPGLGPAGVPVAWLSLFLVAVGSGVLVPALYAGVKEFTDPRTATLGYGLLYSIANLGIVAETFLSPYLRTDGPFLTLGAWQIDGLGLGIRGVYAACAVLTLMLLVSNALLFTRKVEERDRVLSAEPTEVASPSGQVHPLRNARFLFFIFILLPVRTLFAHQWLTLPDYVFRCYPEGVGARFEWISGLNPLIIVLFVPLVAALTRRLRVIDMMLVGTSVSALTTFILVPGPDLGRLLGYVVLFSLGEAMWASRFLEYVADLAPAGKVGAYMGLAGIPWFLAKFTTGLYSGFMLERFVPAQGVADSGQMWLIYGLVALVTPLGLLLARPWLVQVELSPASSGDS